MENLYFDDFEEFACDVSDKYDLVKNSEEYDDVAVVAKYEEARQIVKELACIGYDLHSIDIDDEFDGYNAEYIITLYDNEIFCEPMLREKGYITDDSPVIYVLDNCSSKVIPYCKGKTVYEVTVGDDDCSCDECECTYKKDEKPSANTAKSTYKINNKEVSKKEFDKKYEEFEEIYLDNIRDMLSSYCELMDEVNDWRKLIRW